MAEEKTKKERTINYMVIDLDGGANNTKFESKAQFVAWIEENVTKGVNGISKAGSITTKEGGKFFAVYGRAVVPTRSTVVRL